MVAGLTERLAAAEAVLRKSHSAIQSGGWNDIIRPIVEWSQQNETKQAGGGE